MKSFYDPDEYFLVFDLKTRNLYVVHTIYKLLFNHNRPFDLFPCYLYEGKGVIAKDSWHHIPREQLNYAKELVSEQRREGKSNLYVASVLLLTLAFCSSMLVLPLIHHLPRS